MRPREALARVRSRRNFVGTGLAPVTASPDPLPKFNKKLVMYNKTHSSSYLPRNNRQGHQPRHEDRRWDERWDRQDDGGRRYDRDYPEGAGRWSSAPDRDYFDPRENDFEAQSAIDYHGDYDHRRHASYRGPRNEGQSYGRPSYGGRRIPGAQYYRGEDWVQRGEEPHFSSTSDYRSTSSPSSYGAARPGQHSGKGPKGYKRSDDRIIEDVSAELAHDGDVDASEIEVTCKDGIVVLRGKVDSRSAKRCAEDCCESVQGVTDVRNELEIDEGSFSKSSSSSPSRSSTNDSRNQLTQKQTSRS